MTTEQVIIKSFFEMAEVGSAISEEKIFEHYRLGRLGMREVVREACKSDVVIQIDYDNGLYIKEK